MKGPFFINALGAAKAPTAIVKKRGFYAGQCKIPNRPGATTRNAVVIKAAATEELDPVEADKWLDMKVKLMPKVVELATPPYPERM